MILSDMCMKQQLTAQSKNQNSRGQHMVLNNTQVCMVPECTVINCRESLN